MSHLPAVNTYNRLVANIVGLVDRTRAMLVKNYWQIGRWIVEAEQNGQVRARYGTGLLKRLSIQITAQCGEGFSERNLENMRNFYVKHKISQPAAKLTWSQCVALLPVEDERRLRQFEKDAAREHLSRRKLRAVVAQAQRKTFVPAKAAVLRRPTDLRLGTYQRAAAGCVEAGAGEVGVDCGFGIYRAVKRSAFGAAQLTTKPAYTYTARVERVIDGDTFWVFIDVGFGTTVREKLRLAGIDAPELPTPEGKRAKAFVEKRLPKGSTVVIKTSTSDKYDRYLADVLYGIQEYAVGRETYDVRRKSGSRCRLTSSRLTSYSVSEPEYIPNHGTYLNQELLDAGLATVWADK